jgi:glycosyltransferase involved in cell wall biosynthesis
MKVYKYKLLRTATVSMSLNVLLKGQLRFFQNNGFDVTCVSSYSPELYAFGLREGVRVRVVEMTRKISPFYDLYSLWRMYLLIKEIRPDIVHSHTPKAGIISMLAARIAGVPVRLHTVAGLPLMETRGIKKLILKSVEFLIYLCCTKVLPNSFGLQDYILKERLVNRDKAKVLGNGSSNGIDTEFFSVLSISSQTIASIKLNLGICDSDFVFLFVGRLVKDKGINELVEAFLNVYETTNSVYRPNVKLLLVGPFEMDLDPVSDKTLKIISDNNSILLTGYVSDVRPYFALSDCLVFPSYREGFPNVVLQSGSMGLPSIVSNINGCNEIISDGLNGLIVPPKDVKSLTLAMKRVCFDPNFKIQSGMIAREIIESRYEQKVFWNLLKSEYLTQLKLTTKYSINSFY